MTHKPFYFHQTITHLLKEEEVILYNRLIPIREEEAKWTVEVLKQQYEKECLEYPHQAPPFDEAAALWAAKVLYITAQLLLYREAKVEEVPQLFPGDNLEVSASTILSVDITLRFLPQLLFSAKAIDFEDVLIPLLEKILEKWHYSAIGHEMEVENLDFAPILNDNCVKQLYADRIIEHKVRTLAEHPAMQQQVKGSMGDYATYFWSDL